MGRAGPAAPGRAASAKYSSQTTKARRARWRWRGEPERACRLGVVPAPSPLDVGSREIPKDGVRGQSRERSAECGRRRTPKGPAKARGPGPGRRDGGGGAKGAADAGADGPRAWGSCPAPYQTRAILRGEPATAGPAARAFPVGQGAVEGFAVGGDGRITSTPREDGSQGEGIRNEPKCPRIHLGPIRPWGRATGPLRSLR